jgi:hypothetical protein
MKADREVKMGIAVDRGKGKGGVKVIKVEGRREEEKEVIVRHEVVTSKWKRWSHDTFSRDWNMNCSF